MTPHQLVKGTRHSVLLELHLEHSTKPKGPKLWETSILCPMQRVVKSMAPIQLAQGIRLREAPRTVPRIQTRRFHLFYSHFLFDLSFFFLVFSLGLDGNPLFYGVPSLGCLERPKAR